MQLTCLSACEVFSFCQALSSCLAYMNVLHHLNDSPVPRTCANLLTSGNQRFNTVTAAGRNVLELPLTPPIASYLIPEAEQLPHLLQVRASGTRLPRQACGTHK